MACALKYLFRRMSELLDRLLVGGLGRAYDLVPNAMTEAGFMRLKGKVTLITGSAPGEKDPGEKDQ